MCNVCLMANVCFICIKQTLASLRLNKLQLTALTTSNGKLFHVGQTLQAKLNLRASSLHSGKYNLK